jgi:hypothetical protein
MERASLTYPHKQTLRISKSSLFPEDAAIERPFWGFYFNFLAPVKFIS